jgi:hypothetical protein
MKFAPFHEVLQSEKSSKIAVNKRDMFYTERKMWVFNG